MWFTRNNRIWHRQILNYFAPRTMRNRHLWPTFPRYTAGSRHSTSWASKASAILWSMYERLVLFMIVLGIPALFPFWLHGSLQGLPETFKRLVELRRRVNLQQDIVDFALIEDETEPGSRQAVQKRYRIVAPEINSSVQALVDSVITTSGTEVKWQPLTSYDNFRLVTVHPGSDDDTISCSLKEYSLLNPPSYDAISYCRTTVPGSNTVICDGIEVPVSQSLHDALNAARRLGEGRFWIDDLCISQTDVEERSQQVQNIGQIFRNAGIVCIYLGEECNKTAGALSVIEPFARRFTFSHQKEDLEIVLNLLERPWFERIWVIQEVCNAKEAIVMHGQSVVPWSYIVILCKYFSALYANSAIPQFKVAENISKVCCLDRIQADFHNPEKGHFLLDLVMKTSKFKASDPRDKIFALVGLAKDVTDADWEVRPDYASSVEDVYHRFALWNLAKRGDLRLLSYSRDPDVIGRYSLPSWVPDLSQSDLCRTPELLALSDEPLNPGELVTSVQETSFLFGISPRASYTFETPNQQWKCADGIPRPVRPGLKSWYKDPLGNTNPLNRRRVMFSGDNKIVHFIGMEVDELELLSSPAFPELSDTSSRLFFLLQSRFRKWNPMDAFLLCSFIQDSLLNGTNWFMECMLIKRQTFSQERWENADPVTSTADFAASLCCNRSISDHPFPTLTGNKLLKSRGFDPQNESLQIAPESLSAVKQRQVLLSITQVLQPKQDYLFHALCNGDVGKDMGKHHDSVLEQTLTPDIPSGWRDLYPVIVHWSKARRFGSTQQGRLANVPIGAQPGDKICTILGGSVPYVLRKREDGYYTLIGECYVHGLMYGEAGTPGQRYNDEDKPWYATKQLAIK